MTFAVGDKVRVIQFDGSLSKKVGGVVEAREHPTHPVRVLWPNRHSWWYRPDEIVRAK